MIKAGNSYSTTSSKASIVDEIVCPILGLKLIVFAGFTFTSLMMTNPDAEPISIAVVFAALLSYFGLQAVLILIYMASATTSLQECQVVISGTVGAKKDHDVRDAGELQQLAELVQLTSPSLTVFGQPITAGFVQGMVLYAPTGALLIYGALT